MHATNQVALMKTWRSEATKWRATASSSAKPKNPYIALQEKQSGPNPRERAICCDCNQCSERNQRVHCFITIILHYSSFASSYAAGTTYSVSSVAIHSVFQRFLCCFRIFLCAKDGDGSQVHRSVFCFVSDWFCEQKWTHPPRPWDQGMTMR